MKTFEPYLIRSNLDGFTHENESHNRFHPAKAPQQCGRSKACIAPASPVKAGNRTRIGFLARCGHFFPLNRPDGRDGHTVAETWPESLWRHLVQAVAQANRQPLRSEEGKRQPSGSFCFTMAAVFFLLFCSFPNAKGGLGGLFLFLFLVCFTVNQVDG